MIQIEFDNFYIFFLHLSSIEYRKIDVVIKKIEILFKIPQFVSKIVYRCSAYFIRKRKQSLNYDW